MNFVWQSWRICILMLLFLIGSVSTALGEATVVTDKDDYAPGDTVLVTGTGWLPGETVVLTFTEDPPADPPTVVISTIADVDGNISNREFIVIPHSDTPLFTLSAVGESSGLTAETTFTDFPFLGFSIGLQSPDPIGPGECATYTITGSSYCGYIFMGIWYCPSVWVQMEVISGLPAGATASLSPDPIYLITVSGTGTSELTIATSPATLPGTYLFTVKSTTWGWGGMDYRYRTATLVVEGDNIPPVPDLDPLPVASGECSATIADSPTATDNVCGTVTGTTSDPLTYTAQGQYTVHWTYTDAAGNSSYQDQTVTVQDTTPPVIACPDNIVQLTDPGGCTAVVNYAPEVTDNCAGWSLSAAPPSGNTFEIGTHQVTCTATDVGGNESSCQFSVTVYNPDPVVSITGPPSGAIYAAGTPVEFTGAFTDENGGTHTAEWTCGDSVLAGTVDETSGSVTATLAFETAGVYLVQLTVNDQCGGTGTATTVGELDAMVVVFDPSAGFVTGGGWINSPPEAYAPDPTLVGKANFGFVSKYQKGSITPTGQTEFRFKVADLNFHSTEYDWLVIAGARAQYKGLGTINGGGNYGFMLTAIDGEINGPDDADKFRMKIVDKDQEDVVVYDNQMGAGINDDPVTTLGGGSIVIHTSKGGGSAAAPESGGGPDPTTSLPKSYALLQNHPNPFNPTTRILFELPASAAVSLAVYDVSGRLVRRLVDATMPAGRHEVAWHGRDDVGRAVASGVYFYKIQAGAFTDTKRMVLLK